MMFDIITVLLHSKALRAHCEARAEDRWNEEAACNAIVALRAVADGMGVKIERIRPARWVGTEELALNVEEAARTLANARDGSFDQVGAIVALSLRFGAILNRLGFRVEPIDDDAARGESEAEAAE